ncbi:hypothetical protein OAH18_00780 [bacterium]|nr:hypothetical protein [bacterium]
MLTSFDSLPTINQNPAAILDTDDTNPASKWWNVTLLNKPTGNSSWLIAAAILLLKCGHSAAADEVATTPHEVVVTIDYFDSVYFRTIKKLDSGPHYIEKLTKSLADNGVDTIVVRLSAGGLFEYDSPLSYPASSFDVTHVDEMRKQFSKVDGLADTAIEKYKTERVAAHKAFGKLIAEFDPRKAFVESGHKAGLKVIFWIDLFDDGYPGYRSKFIDENPHCVWTSNKGVRHPAVISYAFEESREFRVAQTKELLSSGADGVYLSLSAHSRHFYFKDDPGEFGYEAPVADVYKQFTGKDLSNRATLDRSVWHHIKGELIRYLYSRIAKECHSRTRRREVWIGVQLGKYTHITTEGNYTGPPRIAWENDWRKLIDQGIADALVLSDYEHPGLRNHPKATRYWANKNIPAASYDDIVRWAAADYIPYAKRIPRPRPTKPLVWQAFHPSATWRSVDRTSVSTRQYRTDRGRTTCR